MSEHEWKPGDLALLPVTVARTGAGRVTVDWQSSAGDGGYMTVCDYDLIPDDRRPSWLPGQPGDVAEFTADATNEYGDPVRSYRWMRGVHGWWAPGMGGNWLHDRDVPADAVLVLPAKTREGRP